MAKILVTGEAGFIGSHVADLFIETGYEVVILDNLPTGHESNINPKAKFYKMDIRINERRNVFVAGKPVAYYREAEPAA
jgi:UDP-glucose 4-epimerase